METQKISNGEKIMNPKEFIEYLNQTWKLFGEHVTKEDFEKKDSDVNKLFMTLFNLYIELCNKNCLGTTDRMNKNEFIEEKMDSIIKKHVVNKKTRKIPKFRWENNRNELGSDMIAQDMYKKSLLKYCTSENQGPISFNSVDSDTRESESKSCIFESSETIINTTTEKTGTLDFSYYDKTDDIDKKISILKKLLHEKI